MNKNFVFLAEGFEEIEAVTPIDVLRRAGMDVKTVSISRSKKVRGAHGVVYVADLLFREADFEGANWLILPGGMPGAENLFKYKPLQELLKKHNKEKKNIAAICASPGVVLGQLGIVDGKYATCYPGFEKLMPNAKYRKDDVVSLDHVITGNGPGSSLKFALAIVAANAGYSQADEIGKQMMYRE